jgi:hypothetical protein
MSTTYPERKLKKLLMITSSGGGGLLQTANAKEQEALAKHPGLQIIRRDLLKDWIWRPIGEYFINFWNKAQKKGSVSAQTFCVYSQFLADIFLHPIIFSYTLYTLFREDIDHVMDTQPLGTSAILKAIRVYNRTRGKNLRLEKVVVDLPTKGATHFFRPIKKLSKRNRRLVQLISIPPLLEEGETEEEFWQSTCKLSAKEIKLEEVYVRQGFRQFKGKKRSTESVHVSIRYKNREELELMEKAFKRGPIQAKKKDHEVEFVIEPHAKLITVLLGSQPAGGATVSYVKKVAALAKEFPETPTYLFVFCADHVEGKETLFEKVAAAVSEMKDFPKHLSVIPFSFQSENVVARLFHRSDLTCTRSGGQTAMELMCVSTGEICIHSEAKNGKDLLKGIPGWESASAVYLQRFTGAKIVTPELIDERFRGLYQKGSGRAHANQNAQSAR